nr:amino acid ABC transporter permease [uncultured Halomonas sp.]
MNALDIDYMLGLMPILLSYLPLTLEMAAAGMVLALILACLMAVVRVLKIPGLNALTLLFISFFRGTPLLVQLFLFYYGLPQLMSALTQINGVTATIMGLTLHFSAYMAESIRAAIVGIDRSQTDAALSIGMTRGQTMRRVVLPQATRVAVPTLMNYFIDMIKATSLAFTLGVTELMGATQKEAAGSFLYFEAFISVALIYWGVVELLAWLQRRLEIRLNRAYQR